MKKSIRAWAGVWALLASSAAQAGVFYLPHFVLPDQWAAGLEPEIYLSSDTGVGLNAKYTHGLSELTNLQGVIGTGGGPRRFRVGSALVFDVFPDIQGQPGIGIATQLMFYSLKTGSMFEVTAIPYIHKNLPQEDGYEFEPYFALPFGMQLHSDSVYKGTVTAVLGTMFKGGGKLRYGLEIGIAVSQSDTYISGGIAYYP